MQINNAIFKKLVSRENFKISDLNKKVPNTKVSKNLTYMDIITFHQYVQAKKNPINITPEEIEALSKETDGRFINCSLNLLLKKLNIPEAIRPKIRYFKPKTAGISGNFETSKQRINIDESLKKDTRLTLMMIRHELEHWKQLVDALRCDSTSEFMVTRNAFTLTLLKKKIKDVTPNNRAYVEDLLANRHQDPDFIRYYKQQKKLQRKVIKYLGKIDENSPEAKDCLRYIEEVNNFNRITSSKLNYQCSYMEYTPYVEEYSLGEKMCYPNQCAIRNFKKINEAGLKKLIELEKNNQETPSKDFKEIITQNPNPSISFFG